MRPNTEVSKLWAQWWTTVGIASFLESVGALRLPHVRHADNEDIRTTFAKRRALPHISHSGAPPTDII
jgi:hypothetical protein